VTDRPRNGPAKQDAAHEAVKGRIYFFNKFPQDLEGIDAGHLTNLGDGAGFVEFSKSPEAEARART
jgi:hypothetical protein